MPHQFLGDHRDATHLIRRGGNHFPTHGGHYLGHPAVDLAVKQLDDFGAPLAPPCLGVGNVFAAGERQWVRQRGKGIGLALVVIGIVWRRLVAAVGALAQHVDAKQIEHLLSILLGRLLNRSLRT